MPKEKKILVLDLDETLIHSTMGMPGRPGDLQVCVTTDQELYFLAKTEKRHREPIFLILLYDDSFRTVEIEGQRCRLNVIKRPHVDRFLRTVRLIFGRSESFRFPTIRCVFVLRCASGIM